MFVDDTKILWCFICIDALIDYSNLILQVRKADSCPPLAHNGQIQCEFLPPVQFLPGILYCKYPVPVAMSATIWL